MAEIADGIIIATKLALERDGKCLSTKYKNMHTKLLWECSKGHRWMSGLTYIKHRKQWCPNCCKRPPLSIKDCINAAKKNDGKCISTKYINCEEKLLWECSVGHRWGAIFRSVRLNKSWCPKCKSSKTQDKLMRILEDILEDSATPNYKGFNWLRNPCTNRKLEIDIWFPSIKLAIEYDGELHFIAKDHFGGEAALNKTKTRDNVKNNLISKSNEVKYFVRFNYKDEITKNYVMSKLKVAGVI